MGVATVAVGETTVTSVDAVTAGDGLKSPILVKANGILGNLTVGCQNWVTIMTLRTSGTNLWPDGHPPPGEPCGSRQHK